MIHKISYRNKHEISQNVIFDCIDGKQLIYAVIKENNIDDTINNLE